VAFAPDTRIFGEAGMEVIHIPTMVMLGSNDTVVPPKLSTFAAYEHLGSAQKALVVFEGGDHFVFIHPCSAGSWTLSPDWFFFCSDAVWDMDRAHDLANHFTTAFLLATLKGDTDAAAALAADQVQFPGITYRAQGF
jgi:predicted dienelactone hydrolase